MPTKDIEKQREYRRNWYAKNAKHARKKIKDRQKEITKWFKEYKSLLSCVHCGENHPAVLEFHHSDPKNKEVMVTRAVGNGWSKERILKEIEKCICLCANCHRKEHWNLQNQIVVQ